MKKKIIALAAALMMFAGVVSASSINGDYKGNPIVKVMSNGKQVETDEVPAQIYDGHTVVPISLLRQLGASVTWDAATYSVDVKLPQATESTSTSIPDIKKLHSDLINEVSSVDYMANSVVDITQLAFLLKFDISNNATQDKFEKILELGSKTNVQQLRLVDQSPTGSVYFFKTSDVRDRFENKITSDEFIKRIVIQPKNGQVAPAPAQSPSSSSSSLGTSDSLESKVDGDFEGFDGSTIIKLTNGQIWQQDDYQYHYHYAYSPSVTIYKDGTSFKMIVDGVDKKIKVKRIK